MTITGRWPRAIFYDSKTTLFDWAGAWNKAAAILLARYRADVEQSAFVETWVRQFEALHRRAAFFRYTPVTELAREALLNAYRMHGIEGNGDDVEVFTGVQNEVELFDDTEEALSNQQALGVKILIYSDVETRFLDLYVARFRKFRADFVGTTEQSGIAKPNPRTYEWVLRQAGMERRDVLYCAAPSFDVQGAMAAGMIAAWLRRPQGRLSRETHQPGDLPADFEVESLHDVTRIVERNRAG